MSAPAVGRGRSHCSACSSGCSRGGRPARRDAAQGGGQQRVGHVRGDRVRVRRPRAADRVHGDRAHLRRRGGGQRRSRAQPDGPALGRLLRRDRQPGRLPGPRHGRAELHGHQPVAARRRTGRARPRPRDRRDVHVRPGPHRAAPGPALARRVLLALHAGRGRADDGGARAHGGTPVARRGFRRAVRHAPAAAGRAALVVGGRPGRRRPGPEGAGQTGLHPRAHTRPQPEPHPRRTRAGPAAAHRRLPTHPCRTGGRPAAWPAVPADPQAGLRRVRPGVARPGQPARARRRAQGRARARCGDREAPRAGGPRAGRRPAPELRAHLRPGARPQRPRPVRDGRHGHRHGLRRRPVARRPRARPRGARRHRRRTGVGQPGGRARRRPLPRGDAPRRQAGQRGRRPARRRALDRLRHRPQDRRRHDDPDRVRARHPGLPRPGDRVRGTRLARLGRLAARRHDLLRPHRAPAPRGHADAVSGLRAAATGAALTHLPRRTAHLALLQAAMDNDPARRPALRDVQRALDEWLRRTASPARSQPAAAPR